MMSEQPMATDRESLRVLRTREEATQIHRAMSNTTIRPITRTREGGRRERTIAAGSKGIINSRFKVRMPLRLRSNRAAPKSRNSSQHRSVSVKRGSRRLKVTATIDSWQRAWDQDLVPLKRCQLRASHQASHKSEGRPREATRRIKQCNR